MQRITPCLWFDTQAEEAANFYVSLFEDSVVTDVQHLDGTPSGDNVALGDFRLAGLENTAINGGPHFLHGGRLVQHLLQGPRRGRSAVVGIDGGWRRRGAVRVAQGSVRLELAGHP